MQSIEQSLEALKTQPAFTQQGLANIVEAFAFHPAQEKFLLQTNSYNEKLAETLLIFRKTIGNAKANGKDLSPIVHNMFLHYVINSDGPITETDSDNFDAFEAAGRYASLLNVGLSKNVDGYSILNIDDKEVPCPAWNIEPGVSAAALLRAIGPVINKARYGRTDVIPSSIFGFDENALTHTLENAMTLADFAHLAYFKPAYIEKQLKAWGYDFFTWIENPESDTQAFVAGKDDHLVVCFRGTSSGKDVLTDLNFFKADAYGGIGQVHRGFQRALQSVWDKVKAAVDKMGADKKLFICGHSLGAAIAQLAAHRFEVGEYNVAHVYVYGSPRVANRSFMEHYNTMLADKTFLHVNHKDIVTTIPLAFLGFHHLGGAPSTFNNGHEITSMQETIASPVTAESETAFDQLDVQMQEEIRQQVYDVERSVDAATRFLTTNPNQLNAGSYETQFEAGAADEHCMDQYLFKFACAIIDREWKQIGKSAHTQSKK